MDKETLSSYGWIVICILVLSVMIALATPFGNFIAGAIKSTTAGFFSVNENALGVAGITIPGQNFDDTPTDETPVALGCDTLYWDGNTDGLLSATVTGSADGLPDLYKVYDIDNITIPVEDDFAGGISITGTSKDGAKEQIPFDGTTAQSFFRGDVYAALFTAVIIVPTDNYTLDMPDLQVNIHFPEAGVYFMDNPGLGNYMSEFTINGYTGFLHSEHCGH